MQQPSWNLWRRLKDESIGTGRICLQYPISTIMYLRIARQGRQVLTNKGEIMLIPELSNAANTIQGALITYVTTQCVGGICRVDNDATGKQDICNLLNISIFRVGRMYLQKIAHVLTCPIAKTLRRSSSAKKADSITLTYKSRHLSANRLPWRDWFFRDFCE
jgi:hypothetical protein